jgi:hypothetical protein
MSKDSTSKPSVGCETDHWPEAAWPAEMLKKVTPPSSWPRDLADQTIGGSGQIKLFSYQQASLDQIRKSLTEQANQDKHSYAPDFYWNPAWDPQICTTQSDPLTSKEQVAMELMRDFARTMARKNVVVLSARPAGRRTKIAQYVDALITLVPPVTPDVSMVLHVIKARRQAEPSPYVFDPFPIVLDSYTDKL